MKSITTFDLSNKKRNDMTIKTTIQIINQLKAENNPNNDKLIAFYERKVREAYTNAINKAFKQGV